jgi:pentose-5-phosphate-3-epimerase
MVSNPGSWVGKLKKKGFKKVIFHYSSVRDVEKIGEVVGEINSKKMKAWIAFNPNVKLDRIIEVITSVSALDGVMFMGHKPGKEKVGLESKVLVKIRTLRKMFARLKIQVDGGVDDRSIIRLKKAGVNIVNVGSFVSDAKDLGEMKVKMKVLKRNIQ